MLILKRFKAFLQSNHISASMGSFQALEGSQRYLTQRRRGGRERKVIS